MGQIQQDPTLILCDNMSALALVANPRFHARTKHIEISHHFIRDAVVRGVTKVSFGGTDDNVADILTKALSKPKHYKHMDGLGLGDYSAYVKGT